MGLFLSRRRVRQLKLFLVSGNLEIYLNAVLLGIMVIIIIFYTKQFSKQTNMNNLLFEEILEEKFMVVKNLDNFWDIMENTLKDYLIFNQREESLSKVVGAVRITHFPVIYPSSCYSSPSKYSKDCNVKNSKQLKPLIAESLAPVSTANCLLQGCREFQKLVDPRKIKVYSSYFGPYPDTAFQVDLNFVNETDYLEQLQKLQDNKWIQTNQSRAIQVRLQIMDLQSKLIDSLELLMENWEGVYVPNFKMEHLDTNEYSNEIFFNLLLSLYIIAIGMFLLKVVFENNIMSTPTQVFQIIMYVVEISFGITYLSERFLIQDIFRPKPAHEFTSSDEFLELDDLKTTNHYRLLLQGISLYAVPYRIIYFLTQIEYFKILVKFSNTIYRVVFPLVEFAIPLLIYIISWTLALFKGLRKYNPQYDNVLQTLINFLTGEYGWTFQNYKQYSSMNPIMYDLYETFQYLMRIYLLLQIFLIAKYSFKQAHDFEFDFRSPFEQKSLDLVYDIKRQIEAFRKSTISLLEGKKMQEQNTKKIIWLNSYRITDDKLKEFYETMEMADIKISEFYQPQESCEFLGHLFKLRPNLLYKSQNYFRIILDYHDDTLENHGEYQESFLKYIPRLLFILKDLGSTIPILIFEYSALDEFKFAQFNKIYKHIFTTTDPISLQKFATLQPLSKVLVNVFQERQLKRKNFNSKNNSISMINLD